MSDAYQQLLEAAIRHLKELKARGVRFVQVSPRTLKGLQNSRKPPSSTTPRKAQASKPAAEPSRPAPHATRSVSPVAGRQPPGPSQPALRPAFSEQALSLGLSGDAPVETIVPALSPEAKAAAFADLRQRAMACVKCPHLASSRRNVVFGVGDINARLMFIGEAPGADEDEQGEPFVGKAGQLLTRIIQAMGLRRESVYIANILKCRPDTPGQSAGNRKPTADEMRTCIPYLHEQIDLIRPQVLVALGGTAAEGLLGRTVFITKMRGQWHAFRGTPLMLTYHPAYLLRNMSPLEKRRLWEDMLQVMGKLDLPISQKQRDYFRS